MTRRHHHTLTIPHQTLVVPLEDGRHPGAVWAHDEGHRWKSVDVWFHVSGGVLRAVTLR